MVVVDVGDVAEGMIVGLFGFDVLWSLIGDVVVEVVISSSTSEEEGGG